MKNLFLVLLLGIFVFNSCKTEDTPTEPNDNNNSTSGVISIGEVTEEISKDIGTEGGTIIVTNSDSPINGLTITVPQEGYDETRNYTVSYAPITSHDLGENFNPISPLITIENGGGYSDMPMSIKIPIEKESDKFIIGFLYDEVTGKIEALPAIMSDDYSITVETRHFATTTISSGSQLMKGTDLSSFANLVISSIDESVLSLQTVVSSGFTPGFDDWEFINYGSYISSGGHCAGQSMTAMWYYYEKYLKGESSLFHRFDKVNNNNKPGILWQDNPLGYRFASTIQEDFNWKGWVKNVNIQSYLPMLTWKTFIAAMLITGEPQFVIIKESATNAGHAMIVYKINVTDGKLYIADPNYPNNRGADGTESIRTIKYSNGKFTPYASYLKVGDQGTVFDQIAFFGKTANIDWPQIGKRYAEIGTEIIGNDRFPKYDLFIKHKNSNISFTDGMITDTVALDLFVQSSFCQTGVVGTDHYQALTAYDENTGDFIATINDTGILSISLNPGKNNVGLYIQGAINGAWEYLDFKWITVYYQKLSIKSNSPNGNPGEESNFTALSGGTAPKENAKYVWSFGENTDKITKLNDSTVSHIFMDAGTYKVTVELYENSTGKKLDEASINFAVGGDPVITEIYDQNYEKAFGEKRNFTTDGNYIRIKGKNFKDVQKIFANGVAFEHLYGGVSGDTLISVKLPQEFKGHLNIKVLTATGESNEFPYLAGIPIDYLSSSDSLTVEFIFIPKINNSLGEPLTRELKLPENGFSKNEIIWDNNVATINLDKIDDITGSIKITFSNLENNTISKVVIDCDKTDKYSLHYEYIGADLDGQAEAIYLIRDNPYLTKNIVLSKFVKSHYESNLQPNSVSGTIVYWDSPESEYRELTFSQLNLSAEGYHYNGLYLELMHFH